MSSDREDPKLATIQPGPSVESCPHCGEELSPWQQVLLAVDRALVCKKCWYRIILEAPEKTGEEKSLTSPTEG